MLKIKSLYGSLTIAKDVPLNLVTDNIRLTQIMLNLIRNGVRFTEKGSIKVCVSWAADTNKIDDDSFQPHPFDLDDEGIFERNQVVDTLYRSPLRNNKQISPVHVLDCYNKTLNGDEIQQATSAQQYGRNQEGILKITVSDTGCGMSDELV